MFKTTFNVGLLFELCDILKKCVNSVSYAHDYGKRETNVVLMTEPTASKLRLFLIRIIRYLIKQILFFSINKFRELIDLTIYKHLI